MSVNSKTMDMKKTFWGILLVLVPVLVSAQDTIVSKTPSKRSVLFEEYTGVRCGNCPRAHIKEAGFLEEYPDQFFAVNIHTGSYAEPYGEGDPDMRTEDGNYLMNRFGVNSFPSGVISRYKFSDSYVANESSWGTYVKQILGMDAYVNVAAEADLDWESRKLAMTVQLYYTGDPASASNRIHVAMTQDHIRALQYYGTENPDQMMEDGNYDHLHVLRDMLTPVEGDEVSSVSKGAFVEKKYEWTLPESVNSVPLSLQNLHFVVYVTESEFNVLNACQAKVTHANGPSHVLSLSKPQPELNFQCEPAARVSFDMQNILGEPVEEVVFSITSKAGTSEYVCKFENPVEQEARVRVETDPFPISTVNAAEEVTVSVAKVNGEDYGFAEEEPAETNVSVTHSLAYAPTSEVVLGICQDRWGADITWELKDPDGKIAYEGGPYRDLSGTGTKLNEVQMDLEKTCYTFTVRDESGDGVNTSFGNGYISMKDAQANEFYRNDGKYGDSLVVMLDVRHTANEANAVWSGFDLYPNPARDYSVLDFELEKSAQIRIRVWEKSGGCVLDLGERMFEAGRHEIDLPLQKLAAGMYFVSLRGAETNLSKKLVVIR